MSLPDLPPLATPRQRFGRLLRIVAVVAGLATVAALVWLRAAGVVLGAPLVVAVAAGIMLSLLLGGVLMGLVYASARSGADDDIGTIGKRSDRR